MGIFGDLAEGIGSIVKAGLPLAQQYISSRYSPEPVILYGGGGGPAGTPSPVSPMVSPTGVPISLAQYTNPVTPTSPTNGEPGFFGSIADYLQGQETVGFYHTEARTRPVSRINRPNPAHPERIDTWLYAGRPVLYSGDLRACRRVNRLARRARVRRGGR